MRTRIPAIAVAATAFAFGAASLAGCSGASPSSQPASGSSTAAAPAVDDSLAALVPAAIRDKGALTIGSDTSYAPSEFLDTDNKTPIGFDVDLIKAVAAVLGLTADVQPADFSAIIPGVVQSGKYDLGVSAFTINAEREKQVDLLAYYSAGTAWAVPAGSTLTPDTACGEAVAVQTGTVQVDDVTARSQACVDAGDEPIQIDQYQAQDAATQAVVSGKDAAMLADSPVVAYAIHQTNGQLEAAGDTYGEAPYGYAIAKSNADLTKAIQGAVKLLIADGTYHDILADWGVEDGAVAASEVVVNPPTQ